MSFPSRSILFPALAALMLATSALTVPAAASTVVIWPVDPTLKPGEQSTALWLENKGDKPVTLQVRSFDWGQRDGQDQLNPQDDVVASPPIATVEPGKRQLVRVFRRAATAPDTAAERSYRLIVDELPQAPQTGGGEASAGLAVQMRYSIPLFVYGTDVATLAPRLVPSYRASAGEQAIEIRNAGSIHARLTDLRIGTGGQQRMVKAGLAGYVLPGATLRIALPDNAPGVVTVSVNGKDVTLTPAI
jgi:fimbrial chaperone protein